MSNTVKIILGIISCCLLIGGCTHAVDIVRGGLFPYRFAPLSFNVFWTALCPLDLAAATLLWTRRNVGIALGVAIMVADVGVNSYGVYGAGLAARSFEPLQAQTLFLGFVLGASALVWKRDDALHAWPTPATARTSTPGNPPTPAPGSR